MVMLELRFVIFGLLILPLFVLPPSLFPPAFICALLLYIVLVIELVVYGVELPETVICFGCM
jgi:hypothetical protein